jgi:hypothetical protein
MSESGMTSNDEINSHVTSVDDGYTEIVVTAEDTMSVASPVGLPD